MYIRRIDIANDADVSEELRNTLLISGGMFISKCASPNEFDAWRSQFPATCHTEDVTPETPLVFVLEEFSARLSAAEMSVVLLHEEGHFALGHFDGASAGMLLDIKYEYAADEYAAVRGGAETLKSALIKLVAFVYEVVAPKLCEGDEETLKILTNMFDLSFSTTIQPRIDRLSAMIG